MMLFCPISQQFLSPAPGIKTSLYLWGRCDVGFRGGVVPSKCYILDNKLSMEDSQLQKNLDAAAKDLKDGTARLVMVYHDSVDAKGHSKGPDSKEVVSLTKFLLFFY